MKRDRRPAATFSAGGEMGKRYRLAVLTSHPIQYQAPLWRKLAEHPRIDLTVYFCTDFGAAKGREPEFGVEYQWDIPLLNGYRHVFLRNYSWRPGLSFWGKINPGIAVELIRERYDGLFVHGHFALTNAMAFAAARLAGTPVLLRAIASLYYDAKVRRPRWLLRAKRLYLRTLYRHFVSAFLSIGSRNREFFLAYGVPEGRIYHCPYAVDNEFFMRESDRFRERRDELRAGLGIPADAFVILFAAKLIEKKNPFEALRAYEMLGDLPGKALLFVGDGRLRGELESYARDRGLGGVRFAGFQNQSAMPKFYSLADVFVRTDLPDKGDWGATVNEALACGVPVICTGAVSSQVDLIRHGENGFVYEVGDCAALAGHLRALLAGPGRLREMGPRCREAVSRWGHDEDVVGILEALERHPRGS